MSLIKEFCKLECTTSLIIISPKNEILCVFIVNWSVLFLKILQLIFFWHLVRILFLQLPEGAVHKKKIFVKKVFQKFGIEYMIPVFCLIQFFTKCHGKLQNFEKTQSSTFCHTYTRQIVEL